MREDEPHLKLGALMIIDYDHNPNITEEQRLQSLKESVQMALDEIASNISKASSASANHIVKEWVQDGWNIRKWADGKTEAWSTKEFGTTTGTLWSGANGIYYSDKTYALPTGVFKDAPKVYASSANPSWAAFGASATTSQISLRAIRPASNGAALTINFYCIG